jgi:hypothetical protein
MNHHQDLLDHRSADHEADTAITIAEHDHAGMGGSSAGRAV